MTNDQANAANVLENTLDLIKKILLKHETLVISEFRLAFEAKKHELQLVYAERDALRRQLDQMRPDYGRENPPSQREPLGNESAKLVGGE